MTTSPPLVPTFVASGPALDQHAAAMVPRRLSTFALPDHGRIAAIHEAEMAAARERMKVGLPAIVKTSGRDKMKVLAKELWDWVQEAMRATDGQWTPPKSLMGKIVADSWRQGDPITFDDCYRMAMTQLERTKAAAAHLVPDVGRKTWEPSTTGR